MENSSLTLQYYQDQASLTDHGPRNFTFPILGLFGEVGTLLSEVKKQQRDTSAYVGYADNVLDELGDVLWYLTAIASRAQISIADIAYATLQDHDDCYVTTPLSYPFIELQSQPPLFSPTPTPAFETTLMRLASAVGALVNDHQKRELENNQDLLFRHLIKVLGILVQAADEAGVTLDKAAGRNLQKIFDRWPKEREYLTPYDNGFPEHEQLPRQLTIEIFECPAKVEGKSYVMQRCNGVYIGDRLTDNIMTPDDYRFHDVFHYAYTAVLGWSPVTRALFRLKRKSDNRIDEGEDGARAALIEEGIATWIFGQAKQTHFFEGLKPGDLSFDLLKGIRKFIVGYEVKSRPLWLWEEAILQGYAAFRFLKEHRRGTIHIDMCQNRLMIESLSI